jgi:hypothetical protein
VSPKFVRGGERAKPQPGTIGTVRPYELHGTRYYAILYQLDADPAAAREARLSFDMIYDDPQPGDRVLLQQVLGVVDRITREADPQSPVTSDQDTAS